MGRECMFHGHQLIDFERIRAGTNNASCIQPQRRLSESDRFAYSHNVGCQNVQHTLASHEHRKDLPGVVLAALALDRLLLIQHVIFAKFTACKRSQVRTVWAASRGGWDGRKHHTGMLLTVRTFAPIAYCVPAWRYAQPCIHVLVAAPAAIRETTESQ